MVVIMGEIRGQTLGGARDFQEGFAPGLGVRAALALQELVQFGIHLFQLNSGQLWQFGDNLSRTHILISLARYNPKLAEPA